MLAQGAWAVSAALAAVILLLLLGTQVLDWQWLVVLPVATLALGGWLTVRRLPPPYTIAQMVDRRLGLADSLSTALFFDTAGRGRNVPAGVREWQAAQAKRLSENIDIRAAVPFSMPRAVYSVAILGVAASSLFALRYGLEEKLDLRTPLAGIIRQAFGLNEQQAAALDRRQAPPVPNRKRLDMEQMMQGLSVQDGLAQEGQQQGEALDAAGSPSTEKVRQATERAPGQEQGAEGDEMAEGGDESNGISTGSGNEGQEGQQGKQGKEGRESAGKQNSGDNSNNSLLAKFREAMQNLMSRMRQPPTGSQGGQQQSAQNQQGRQGQQKSGEGQQQGQGQQQASGQDADGQDGQPGADAQMAQNASGKGSAKSGEENSSKQPGSGIGKQDGDKDIQNAEQLAAMGKLSEILGKRSASITGEISVEVQSNDKQQLQTPYSQRRATQGEAVAEISRDEVPLGLESYVQQYFEHVRKAPAARR